MFEAIPSRGANSIISSFCGAVSGRLAAAPTHARRGCRSLPRSFAGRQRELLGTTVVPLPVPDLGALRLPQPYHFLARIQSFQAVAAPISGFWARRPCRQALPLRDAGDRNAAVPKTDRLAQPSPGAPPRAAPRPIGCKRRRERLRRNWTLGLLDQRGDERTKVEQSRNLVKKLFVLFEAGELMLVSAARPSSTGALSVSAAALRETGNRQFGC